MYLNHVTIPKLSTVCKSEFEDAVEISSLKLT